MRKIIPPILFFISIAMMVFLWWFLPLAVLITYPVNLFGIVFIVPGVGVAKRGADMFEKMGTNIETFDDPTMLVTDGLFRISRNPMYLGFVVALIGVFVLLGTLSSLLVVIAFFVITDRWYIGFEEEVMAETFGSQYEDYKKRTRRWL